MDKSFYDKLPGMVCEMLDNIILQYENEEWFAEAWEEYKKHVEETTNMDDIRMPGFVFKKYIEGKKN